MQTALISTAMGGSPAGASAAKSKRAIECAFTIDVEDWYQSSVDFDAPITDRVVRNVERLLAVLDTHSVKGTFFVQGMVAEKFPKLMEVLLMEGHEIQSHGYSHRPLYGMTPQQLRSELEFSRKTVEDACGVQVTAFRAPDFSILKQNLWALDVLAEAGFKVDSSIFPMKMKRYGIKGWGAEPRKVQLKNGGNIWEVPVAVWKKGTMRLPIAGGGYFRLLPHAILRRALRSMILQGQVLILYCHPYEFSDGELRAYRKQVPKRFLFTQNLGRRAFVKRVSSLMQEFAFGRFDEVLASRGIQ